MAAVLPIKNEDLTVVRRVLRAIEEYETAPQKAKVGLVKAERISKILDIPKPSVYRLARAGKIPSVQVSTRTIRFDEQAVLDAVRERE